MAAHFASGRFRAGSKRLLSKNQSRLSKKENRFWHWSDINLQFREKLYPVGGAVCVLGLLNVVPEYAAKGFQFFECASGARLL